MSKVIVAGSREGFFYDEIEDYIDSLQIDIDEIVSGTARGVDKLGERYAQLNNIPVKRFPADWDKFGKSAGYKRNVQMAEYADVLIAFSYNKSKGTTHMINIAKENKLKVYEIHKK